MMASLARGSPLLTVAVFLSILQTSMSAFYAFLYARMWHRSSM